VPFVLFSASYPTPDELVKARGAGAECCLDRPVDPEKIIAAVKRYLPQRKHAAS
jgi:hypothetical protein